MRALEVHIPHDRSAREHFGDVPLLGPGVDCILYRSVCLEHGNTTVIREDTLDV